MEGIEATIKVKSLIRLQETIAGLGSMTQRKDITVKELGVLTHAGMLLASIKVIEKRGEKKRGGKKSGKEKGSSKKAS